MFNDAGKVYANNSQLTEKIVGHMPVAANVKIDKSEIILGESVNVNYSYDDDDDDGEAVPIVKWFYNGSVITGENSLSYTPTLNIKTGQWQQCSNFTVTAEITPRSISGDPLIGLPKESTSVNVILPTVNGFSFPVYKNHIEAESYCSSIGARLPSKDELINLFNTHAIGGDGIIFSEKYGWPTASDNCGGAGSYWTNERDTGDRFYFIQLGSGEPGITSQVFPLATTCIY